MDSLEKAAAYYRLGLQLGKHSAEDVIAWADGLIAATEEPSIDLIYLSLMAKSHPLDMSGMLGRLAGNIGSLDVLPAVLADAHKLLLEEREFGPILARGLRALYVDCGYDVPEPFKPICWLEEYYVLAQLGLLGKEEDVFRELVTFTARFQEVTAEDNDG